MHRFPACNARANHLALVPPELGMGPEMLVAIAMERSAQLKEILVNVNASRFARRRTALWKE